MLRIPTAHTVPGMMLAIAVHHPHVPGTVLLREGVRLDEHAIPKLRELGIHEVWIRHPGTEDLVRFVDPRLLAAYRALAVQIGVAVDASMVQSHLELDYFVYRRAVVGVLDELAANPKAAVFVADLAGGDRPFVRHSGNVCVLSLLMGLKLDFYLVQERSRLSGQAAKDIAGLGVGALFHDLGLTRLPPHVLTRWNEGHDESDIAWRDHTRLGYELVKDHVDPSAAGVVLHHHQRYDGTGFPARAGLGGASKAQAGSDIHIFARIVAAADRFDRLRHPAHAPGADDARHPSIPAVRAHKALLEPGPAAGLDPLVLKALLAVAPPFPPGSVVTLSDGRQAAVVGLNPSDPCRPVVQILESLPARGRVAAVQRVDLRQEPGLTIAAIDGHDVRGDLFEPRTGVDFDLAKAGRAMVNRAQSDLASDAA